MWFFFCGGRNYNRTWNKENIKILEKGGRENNHPYPSFFSLFVIQKQELQRKTSLKTGRIFAKGNDKK